MSDLWLLQQGLGILHPAGLALTQARTAHISDFDSCGLCQLEQPGHHFGVLRRNFMLLAEVMSHIIKGQDLPSDPDAECGVWLRD
jgi:hypothetical protein